VNPNTHLMYLKYIFPLTALPWWRFSSLDYPVRMGLLLRNPSPQTSLQPPVLILLTMDMTTRWSICPVTSDFTTFWVVFHALCSQVQIVHIMRSVLIRTLMQPVLLLSQKFLMG
jgi:hypothetical protein